MKSKIGFKGWRWLKVLEPKPNGELSKTEQDIELLKELSLEQIMAKISTITE